MKSPSCQNSQCAPLEKACARKIISYGCYQTSRGKRRRYPCQAYGKTFPSTTGTAYFRLQHRRTSFDELNSLSVEGLYMSAVTRVKRIAWNTEHRWLERAAWSWWFNGQTIRQLSIAKLQADEIQPIVASKDQPVWTFVVIDV